MNLNPSHRELWERVVLADDTACNGGWQDSDCRFCQSVVEILRGGSVYCPDCDHINGIGHSCSDWRQYDAGEIDLDEVGRRADERDRQRWPTTGNPTEHSLDWSPS